MVSIVYLDDEVYLTDIFLCFFKEKRVDLTVFNDEFAAIEFCIANPPDILFVDFRLETLKGDEIAQRVPCHIKKVLVTGDIQIDTRYEFDALVAKPFRLAELLDTVKLLSPDFEVAH